jgi:hypothetical protein
MGLMSARRLVLVAVAWLFSLAAGALLAAPVALAESCPNEAARSGPSLALPECRAYEQLTPMDKSGIVQDLNFESSENLVVAENGERFALKASIEGLGQTPEPFESFIEFIRTPTGWQIQSVNPPGSGGTVYGGGYGQEIFSPDLTDVATFASDENLLPTSNTQFFAAGPPGGPLTTLASMPIGVGLAGEAENIYGATPDFSSIYFASRVKTLAGAPTGTFPGAHDLYQWREGRLTAVAVNSEGVPVSTCGAEFKAVSEDGSKIFFKTPFKGHISGDPNYEGERSCVEDPQGAFGEPDSFSEKRVWMRDGSNIVEIGKPEAGVTPEEHQEVRFIGASKDGSKVFIVTAMNLTKATEGEHSSKLYEYNTDTSTLTLIAKGLTGGIGGEAYASADGSRVYYEAVGPGGPVWYRYNTVTGEYHDTGISYTASGPIGAASHTAELPEDDSSEGITLSYPEGKYIAYFTALNNENRVKVYRYDDETGEVTCVSCMPNEPTGEEPSEQEARARMLPDERGESFWPRIELWTWDQTPPWTYVSEDGKVFFESTTRLVPQAVNVDGGNVQEAADGDGPISDVYEWHNGVVSLIGSPNDPFSQHLLGVSPDGRNVFIDSHAPLVPQEDFDAAANIFDARVEGGFAFATESAACQGDTCIILPPALNDPTPGSASFSGPGNPAPVLINRSSQTKPKLKRCGKGRVLKRGKCVKRPKAKRAARRAVKHNRGGSK